MTGWTADGKCENGFMHLINSGAAALDGAGHMTDTNGTPVMKPWWEVTDSDIKATMEHADWCPADLDYFRGGGYSSRFETSAEMPVTLARVNLIAGLGPTLQIAEGWTVALPDEATDILMKRTDPTWPCTWFTPRCDRIEDSPFKTAYDVMNNWGANYRACRTYGPMYR